MRVDAETTKEVESKLRALLHDTELVYSRLLLLTNFGPRLSSGGYGRKVVTPFLYGAIQGFRNLLECMSAPEPVPAPEQTPDEDEEFEDFGDLDDELDDDEDYDDDDDDVDDPCEHCESTTCITSPAYKKPRVTSLWGVL